LFSPTLLLFKFNLAKVVEYAIYLSNQLWTDEYNKKCR
jgi:hypothetical protein